MVDGSLDLLALTRTVWALVMLLVSVSTTELASLPRATAVTALATPFTLTTKLALSGRALLNTSL